MKCPYCKETGSKVIDSRPTDEDYAIRRRRECLSCGSRFTTYEKVEQTPILVIKKDGSREAFRKDKMLRGIIRACESRPISIDKIEKAAVKIEKNISNLMLKEVDSNIIGEEVMKELKEIDEVAYVRFASVYRNFKDINTFMDELQKLMEEKKEI